MNSTASPPPIPLVEVREIGVVREIAQGIVRADGLPNCVYGQLVGFSRGQTGMVFGFDENAVSVLVLGEYHQIQVGDLINGYDELLTVPVGENFCQRVVDCLGRPLDGKGAIRPAAHVPLFREAPGITERAPLELPLLTGIKVLDAVIPLGKGQRQLIVGDRQVGKTTLALDCIINQKNTDVIAIYCFIGSTLSNFEKALHVLRGAEMLSRVVAVCAPAAASAAEQFICPYTAICIGEYFMRQRRDVLLVFDDLTKHAWAYRQLSLLLERSPGREAYPGDIFYVQAQMMERAGRLKPEHGGGSLTYLPIAETQQGDLTGYIPSNLISMTDGQIYLNTQLFYEGIKPAVDVGLSVSRLGVKVQPALLRPLCADMRIDAVQYREGLRVSRLRTSGSDEKQQHIRRGECLELLFQQRNAQPVCLAEAALLFVAYQQRILEIVPLEQTRQFIQFGFMYLQEQNPELLNAITAGTLENDVIIAQLSALVRDFFRQMRR